VYKRQWLHDIGRVEYVAITDREALDAFQLCSRLEGIIPALEPAHALAQVAKEQGKEPLDALMDFVIADKAQTGAIYFIASENDLRCGLQQPWTSIGLDGSETSLDGPLFDPHSHPRAFGSMPRFLGHYVRKEHLLPLEQAVRKITSLPAQRERLRDRGLLREGFFADITIFDPATIIDKATYENPAEISEGVKFVFVNGKLEYEGGKLTGTNAGRVLRGPGWTRSEITSIGTQN